LVNNLIFSKKLLSFNLNKAKNNSVIENAVIVHHTIYQKLTKIVDYAQVKAACNEAVEH